MPTANLTESSWLNAVATAALLGLMGWNLLTTHNLSTQLGVTNATMQFALQDRYTSTEAKADNLVLSSKIKDLEEQLDSLRQQVRKIESVQ